MDDQVSVKLIRGIFIKGKPYKAKAVVKVPVITARELVQANKAKYTNVEPKDTEAEKEPKTEPDKKPKTEPKDPEPPKDPKPKPKE